MRALAALAAALLAAGPAAAERLPPERTDPDHLRGRPSPYEAPQPGLPPTRHVRPTTVYRLPGEMREFAVLDKELSRLCQRGAFTQATNGFYWARTPGRSFGVAFSGGANLYDPQKKRAPGKVYFFENADIRCTVWVADQAALMPHYVGPKPGE